MDKSMFIIILSPQSDSAANLNQNKKLHKQRHGEAPFALLLCHFLFPAYYTLFLTI